MDFSWTLDLTDFNLGLHVKLQGVSRKLVQMGMHYIVFLPKIELLN